jgi:membrane associated rhomboid family serine protease
MKNKKGQASFNIPPWVMGAIALIVFLVFISFAFPNILEGVKNWVHIRGISA